MSAGPEKPDAGDKLIAELKDLGDHIGRVAEGAKELRVLFAQMVAEEKERRRQRNKRKKRNQKLKKKQKR